MNPTFAKRPITVKEYRRMGETNILDEQEKIELINGEIINMSPTGSKHAAVVNKMSKLLHTIAKNTIISVQNPIAINNLSEPEPDIAILAFKENFYADAHPGPRDVLLIIEVAESSVTFDKEVKLPLYAQAGIPETWLVDLNENRIEVHKNPEQVYKQIEYKLPGDSLYSEVIGQALNINDLVKMS